VTPPSPSGRALAGIALLLVLIALLAVCVAGVARVVGTWPVLIQGLFYVAVVICWTMPLKLLVRWIVTGRVRTYRPGPRN
jgi:hypothetical protein